MKIILVCEYKGLLYRGIRNQDKWLEKIIVDNDLQSKNLVNSILPETDEDLETIFQHTNAKKKNYVKSLLEKLLETITNIISFMEKMNFQRQND